MADTTEGLMNHSLIGKVRKRNFKKLKDSVIGLIVRSRSIRSEIRSKWMEILRGESTTRKTLEIDSVNNNPLSLAVFAITIPE